MYIWSVGGQRQIAQLLHDARACRACLLQPHPQGWVHIPQDACNGVGKNQRVLSRGKAFRRLHWRFRCPNPVAFIAGWLQFCETASAATLV